jgi:hypothetical protein
MKTSAIMVEVLSRPTLMFRARISICQAFQQKYFKKLIFKNPLTNPTTYDIIKVQQNKRRIHTMFYCFINFTTSEEIRVPTKVHASPMNAKMYLYYMGYADFNDQVEYIGLVD